ncbi:MAG: dsdA [Clostridia bacterium]|jgi:D-serine dehydratase|nr:dsdA [Clostridia bacterium]
MEQQRILGKSMEQWILETPILSEVISYKQVLWTNDKLKDNDNEAYEKLELNWKDIREAEERWNRFAPLIARLFPETAPKQGIIESNLTEIEKMKNAMRDQYTAELKGRLFLKCDNSLPVAGSIKARGGLYEVLKHAEKLALGSGLLKEQDDYSVMADEKYREFFSGYSLAVGSTGNLGLSIGIMGTALGFRVTVHMSADAKQWKKDLLRSKGVTVVEYESDYSKAVEEGRRLALQDPMCHFVDDEHSKDLFLGYSVAAIRLKHQLDALGITVDREHPLFVYLPCGVGGAPGGICFGLKHIWKDAVHCFFVEPTHSPCMLIGLATGANDGVSVQDFGIDNITEGDGLAVGRASGFVGKVIEELISGVYTIEDDELYKLLALLKDSEGIEIEPSAAAGLMGPCVLSKDEKAARYLENAVHIAWATGGAFVPAEMKRDFYEKGKRLLRIE